MNKENVSILQLIFSLSGHISENPAAKIRVFSLKNDLSTYLAMKKQTDLKVVGSLLFGMDTENSQLGEERSIQNITETQQSSNPPASADGNSTRHTQRTAFKWAAPS